MLSEVRCKGGVFQRRMRPLLGTFVEVAARGDAALTAIEQAFAMMLEAQALWSFQDASSELSQLNSRPGQVFTVHRLSARLLRIARALMLQTQGVFDCTLGGELIALGVLPDHGGVPTLARGCADDLVINGCEVLLRRPVRLCLDGIAKGYAIDCAIHVMRCAGVRDGWINAGGDLRVFGDAVLPVQRRELDGSLSNLGYLREAALASSHVAAQVDIPFGMQLESECKDFPAHIIATTAEPAQVGVWSVMAKSAWRADALTKVAATLPADRAAQVIADLGACLLRPE